MKYETTISGTQNTRKNLVQGTSKSFENTGAVAYLFGFNGKEKDDEITQGQYPGSHLNFMFRIYDSRIGRFLSVDPLSSNFPWNSSYAFAENRVIDGGDLEGKEWEKKTFVDPNGVTNVTYTVKLKVVNNSKLLSVRLDQENIMMGVKQTFESSLTQFDKDNNIQYNAVLEYEFVDKESDAGDFYMVMTDLPKGRGRLGRVSEIGNTEQNRIELTVSIGGTKTTQYTSRSGAHELGHTGGLVHWISGGIIKSLNKAGVGFLMQQTKDSQGTKVTNYELDVISKTIDMNKGLKGISNMLKEKREKYAEETKDAK